MSQWSVRAQAQHGLITFKQLVEAGVPASTIVFWVASGRLVQVQPRVYRVEGVPVTWEQRVLAAVLAAGPGAAASHRTAAVLWGLLAGDVIEIVVPRGWTPDLRGVVVHQTRDPIITSTRRGIPVTTPMRTLVDLGAVTAAPVVQSALDTADVLRLCSIAAVEWELVRIARPGRRGAGPCGGCSINTHSWRHRPTACSSLALPVSASSRGSPCLSSSTASGVTRSTSPTPTSSSRSRSTGTDPTLPGPRSSPTATGRTFSWASAGRSSASPGETS